MSVTVVVFSSGPTLRASVRRFVCRLENHPDIQLLAVYCETKESGLGGIVRDAWRRRGILAGPVLALTAAGAVVDWLTRPKQSARIRACIRSVQRRIHYVPDIHAEGVIENMRAQSPDVGLVYGSPILRPELFEIPRLGTLGIHHGRMPEYRGKKTTFWALYNGDPTAGVTIQKINAGLDTGTIVAEGHVDARGRSLRAVWNDLEQRGLDLYITAIPGYVRGELVPSAWDGPRGKLYRDPGARDILRFIWRRYRPGSK